MSMCSFETSLPNLFVYYRRNVMSFYRLRFFLIINYQHFLQTSSQPVTENSENARQTRQLDFGECCPCPVPGQGSVDADDGVFVRARDVDDCPCRPRSSDSEGASSMFFPSSMRSIGNFVRYDFC